MIYSVQAQVVSVNNGWRTSRQIATFFLDSAMQGIIDLEHAEQIARGILEHSPDCIAHVCVAEVPDATIIERLGIAGPTKKEAQ